MKKYNYNCISIIVITTSRAINLLANCYEVMYPKKQKSALELLAKLNKGWVKYPKHEYVDMISFDGKERFITDKGVNEWKRRSGETRSRRLSFQGIYATFSISGDPRDVRISVVVSHATHAKFPYRRRMCFLQDVVSLMCLPWPLTLIEPSRVFPSARLEYPLEEHPCSSVLSLAVRWIQIARCAMLMDCRDLEVNDPGSIC